MSATLELARELIRLPSITPDDAGCQTLLIERLQKCGFAVEPLPFGNVSNFWATLGESGPLLVFAGHTDVVPPGPEQEWRHPPFSATVKGGLLHGRGAADMKGSLAAMVTACERFLQQRQPVGQLAFLITSDEEGDAVDGTRRVMETLLQRGVRLDYCVVGEPSSTDTLGDVIRIGRRGSLSATLTLLGTQGHVAYPHLARNPLHAMLDPLAELCRQEWDNGNEAFPATSFQISNIRGGTGAENIIPGSVEIRFNLRFSTELDETAIRRRTEAVLDNYDIDYRIDWRLSGDPFLTPGGALIDATVAAVKEITGVSTQMSTGGGTSDGRFIAPAGVELVELGPLNHSIHKVNEQVSVEDLDQLSRIYQTILDKLL
ncbi:MAG: succinyl-diaminopimelate desuccinylase [Pseudohongiellaceae bacterium]